MVFNQAFDIINMLVRELKKRKFGMEVFLVYSANKSLLSKMIQFYTKETYNHVSISLDKELVSTYSFGRKKMSNPLIGGFVQEDFWDPFFLTSECAIYSLDITEKEYNKLLSLIEFFEKNKALFKYNFIGLLALSLQYNLERENAYFCSEFIATLLSESNVTSFDKENQFITPQDLLELHGLEKIYEGDMFHYLTKENMRETLNVSAI